MMLDQIFIWIFFRCPRVILLLSFNLDLLQMAFFISSSDPIFLGGTYSGYLWFLSSCGFSILRGARSKRIRGLRGFIRQGIRSWERLQEAQWGRAKPGGLDELLATMPGSTFMCPVTSGSLPISPATPCCTGFPSCAVQLPRGGPPRLPVRLRCQSQPRVLQRRWQRSVRVN